MYVTDLLTITVNHIRDFVEYYSNNPDRRRAYANKDFYQQFASFSMNYGRGNGHSVAVVALWYYLHSFEGVKAVVICGHKAYRTFEYMKDLGRDVYEGVLRNPEGPVRFSWREHMGKALPVGPINPSHHDFVDNLFIQNNWTSKRAMVDEPATEVRETPEFGTGFSISKRKKPKVVREPGQYVTDKIAIVDNATFYSDSLRAKLFEARPTVVLFFE